MSTAPAFEREKSVESESGAPIVEHGRATKGEIAAWAAYDIANATYGTVVATAVYNAYFVDVICGPTLAGKELGTFLLSVVIIPLSAIAIVLTAPVLGTIVDAMAAKKKMLFVTTTLCIVCTAMLSIIPPGQVLGAVIALTLANFFFGTGEDLIAAFLPELSTKETMGRISSIGWGAGYVGSLIALGLCHTYFNWAKGQGQTKTEYVPFAMLICAILFFFFSLPTFIFLKERATAEPDAQGKNYFKVGFDRLKHTVNHARHYRDLFNFLLTLCVYSCGSTAVIHLASVYAQQVLHFTFSESVVMIFVVSITAAIGAGLFGMVQDRIGAIKTLAITLSIWTVAILIAGMATEKIHLWIAANFVGIAMGATGSTGRALVGQFSPPGRSGEFLGLWGMAHKLATCVGAVTFGAVAQMTGNNYRVALLSCGVFFIAGLLLLWRVDEKRGRLAAMVDADVPV